MVCTNNGGHAVCVPAIIFFFLMISKVNPKFNLLVVTLLILIPHSVFGQKNITEFSGYWKHRVSLFRNLPNPAGEICFLGDSITDGCEWRELTGLDQVTNRGISSDTGWGVLKRIEEVTEGKPAKIFLMIGTNDLDREKSVTEVRDQIRKILEFILRESPGTEIYLQSVLPVWDNTWGSRNNATINQLNKELLALVESTGVRWIDLASHFKDGTGSLRKDLTEEGLHLNGMGYKVWYSVIRKYLPSN